MTNTFFIISAARSGSSAMCKILGNATNVEHYLEPFPKLCLDQRNAYRFGTDKVDFDSVCRTKAKLIEKTHAEGSLYLDKQPNYIMFMDQLQQYFDAKLIVCFRDGRDVVASFMDWVEVRGKELYLSHEDIDGANYVDPAQNPWEYSLFRPQPGTAMHEKWKSLPSFEKFSWYWNEANRLIINQLNKINSDKFKIINWSETTPEDFEDIFDWCGFEGFDLGTIQNAYYAKYNSVEERKSGISKFPRHNEWTKEMQTEFDFYCHDTMQELGFY